MNFVLYDSLEQASDQQKKWFYRYLANGFNASEAARFALYEDGQQSGWENKKRFSKLIAEELKQFQMSKDEALARISSIARGDLSDFLETELAGHTGHYQRALSDNDEGEEAKEWQPVLQNTVTFDFEKAAKAGKLHLIRKLKIGKQGVSLELYDALKANHLIAAGFGASEDDDSELDGILEALRGVNETVDVHTEDEANTS